MLEEHLSQNEWLIGDDISLADLCYLPYINILSFLKVNAVFDAHPNLTRWFSAVKARPAFAQSFDRFVSPERLGMISVIADKSGPVLEQKFSSAA